MTPCTNSKIYCPPCLSGFDLMQHVSFPTHDIILTLLHQFSGYLNHLSAVNGNPFIGSTCARWSTTSILLWMVLPPDIIFSFVNNFSVIYFCFLFYFILLLNWSTGMLNYNVQLKNNTQLDIQFFFLSSDKHCAAS